MASSIDIYRPRRRQQAPDRSGDLTPEELTRAKQAWEEGRALEAADNARHQKLFVQVGDPTKLDALIARAGDAEKLERLLQTFPVTELEAIFAKLTDSTRLGVMMDHVGVETGAGMIRRWMLKGKFAQMT